MITCFEKSLLTVCNCLCSFNVYKKIFAVIMKSIKNVEPFIELNNLYEFRAVTLFFEH